MRPEQLIVGSDLGVTVAGRELIRHIDLEITRHRILTVIGPNGAGKTTLVRLALGLLEPSHGRIRRAPGLRIGYMPQRLRLPESMPLSVRRWAEGGGRWPIPPTTPRSSCRRRHG